MSAGVVVAPEQLQRIYFQRTFDWAGRLTQ